jgi:RNA polymerase sigma factor (sigma-70 family)
MAPLTAPEDPRMPVHRTGPPLPPDRSNAPPVRLVDGSRRDGFDDLYRDEWTPLVALGWSLTGSWSAAEDLVQDAFADAFRRWDHVAGLDRPGAWVRRAVINRAASDHRHRGVESRGLARAGSLRAVDADGRSTDRTGDAAAGRVDDPAFWSAVRALPDRQRACVALEELSVDEIAGVLDCRPGTVKVHLHRGRQALARRLAAIDARPTRTATDLPEEDR